MTLILSGTDGVSDIDGTAATPAIRGTDANTGIFFGTDIIGFSEGGTEAMRINASGNLQTIGTISVGNATPSTSGAGITFPATQSASSDANTLDDYEEGTWTPTVTSSGGSLTSYTSAGYYTKCGRMVQITGGFLITNAGTASGSANIAGLPFTSFNTTGMGAGNRNAIGSAREDGVAGTVQGFYVNPNATTANVFGNPTITWTVNYQYTFTVVYFTS